MAQSQSQRPDRNQAQDDRLDNTGQLRTVRKRVRRTTVPTAAQSAAPQGNVSRSGTAQDRRGAAHAQGWEEPRRPFPVGAVVALLAVMVVAALITMRIVAPRTDGDTAAQTQSETTTDTTQKESDEAKAPDATDADKQADTANASDQPKDATDQADSAHTEDSSATEGSSPSSTQGATNNGTPAATATQGTGSQAESTSATDASGWIQGEACATDVAESGTVTASEIPLDDSVPQVGLDARSNPFGHFGDYVEVRYGDVVVRAQVVDYGDYNGGTTGIMINPAVFRQFGATSVDDWGRRQVSYRFV